MEEKLFRKVSADKDKVPDEAGFYATNYGMLYFVKSKNMWLDCDVCSLEWWLEPVENTWNSPDQIPPENDDLFPEYSITVLITDGKHVCEGYYDRDYKQWDWNCDVVLNDIIGWQYMPELPKSNIK